MKQVEVKNSGIYVIVFAIVWATITVCFSFGNIVNVIEENTEMCQKTEIQP